MDEVSKIITVALQATSATTTKSSLSRARYVIDQKVADECGQRVADASQQPAALSAGTPQLEDGPPTRRILTQR